MGEEATEQKKPEPTKPAEVVEKDNTIEEIRLTMSRSKWASTMSRLQKDSPKLATVEPKKLFKVIQALEREGIVATDSDGNIIWVGPLGDISTKAAPVMANDKVEGCNYKDYSNLLPTLDTFYKLRAPTILIGPHGSGKTEGVTEFARQKGLTVYTVPCSLGVKEHNFIGRLNREANGEIKFKDGPVPLSMMDENGGLLYLDELNAAEADVLLRLDEVLDARREVNIEGKRVVASDKWWCVATINPLDHSGTKELPNQIMSRFSHRIFLTYPDSAATEQDLVYKSLKIDPTTISHFDRGVHSNIINAIRTIREVNSKGTELPYTPSLRESIAAVRLLIDGAPLKMVTKHIIIAPYYQWGNTVVGKVVDFLTSKLGKENVSA